MTIIDLLCQSQHNVTISSAAVLPVWNGCNNMQARTQVQNHDHFYDYRGSLQCNNYTLNKCDVDTDTDCLPVLKFGLI